MSATEFVGCAALTIWTFVAGWFVGREQERRRVVSTKGETDG